MIHTPAELPGRSQGASRISQFWLALHWQTEEYHRAHKMKQLSWNIKISNLEMNATPFHAWTAHCTGCSQDKNLFIEKKHMAASWQEILLQKTWYLLKGSQSSTYSSLHWWLDWVIAHQLLSPTILVAGQVLSSRPAAHRALGPQGQELPVPPGQPTLDHHFPDCPTRICQTSWLKVQLEAEPPPPRLPQSVSEADLCEWSILLPPSVLQNLQANPGSFPLEMHFLQM